jgi:hypothetical protein
MNLLEGSQFGSRVHDFLNVIELNKMARSRQFDSVYILLREAILNSVLLLQSLFLLRCKLSLLIYKESKLSYALLFLVLFSYPIDVNMESHKLCKRLLTHQTLSL